MKQTLRTSAFTTLLIFFSVCCFGKTKSVDVLIIGGGASGAPAGIQAARLGVKTLIAEEFEWLGGMLTSAGVSAIDGNNKLPSGLWGEFRDSLVQHYGSPQALKTGWVSSVLFEPSVGDRIWKNIASKEADLQVLYKTTLRSIKKNKTGWTVVLNVNGRKETYKTKIVIDGTELGDVAKACGVSYDIGMEARDVCGESIAPEQANDIIQDLTYAAILKDYGVGADKSIEKPEGYDPSFFYCSCVSPKCKAPQKGRTYCDAQTMLNYGKLPNNKYMVNWPIEGNDYYVNIIEMNPKEREEALKKAKNFSLCFLYYIQQELGFKHYGLADDEYPTVDKLPFIPYHRESRRIHGVVRLNVNHLAKPFDQKEALYRTAVAVGDYPVDHHHARHPEWLNLPELHFFPVPSFSLPMGTLIPQDKEGLIVAEKSISVSNLVNGTTRLQPVVMQIGQVAGVMAALSVKNGVSVRNIPVRDVQNILLSAKGYLMPYLDLRQDDPHFMVLQRIGATGILRGEGKNVGWSNETWFHADKDLSTGDLKDGLTAYYPNVAVKITEDKPLNIAQSVALLSAISGKEINIDQKDWASLSLVNYDPARTISRKEFAVIMDKYIDPFNTVQIDLYGNLKSDKN